jgi:hypothetical protein
VDVPVERVSPTMYALPAASTGECRWRIVGRRCRRIAVLYTAVPPAVYLLRKALSDSPETVPAT